MITYRIAFTGRTDGALGSAYPMIQDIEARGPGAALAYFRQHAHDVFHVEPFIVHTVAEVIHGGVAVQNVVPVRVLERGAVR